LNGEIRRIPTLNTLNAFILHKEKADALFFNNAPAFFIRLRLNTEAPRKLWAKGF
jgi:hypothetical protein